MTHPLRSTAARIDRAHDWLSVRFSGGGIPAGFVRCSGVDFAFVADWEARAAQLCRRDQGRSHPMTATGYVLSWYAGIAPTIGALTYLIDRRVPRLDAELIAFDRCPDDHHPDRVAILSPTFWCLPDDPDAEHPDATVVTDLAAVLRAQIRSHADRFLAHYRPGARLPRRHLLGAFYDGLDSGFWLDDTLSDITPTAQLERAREVLPGGTAQFCRSSSLEFAGDQLTRRRASCCYYYKVSDDGQACSTCPRNSPGQVPADRAASST